MIFIIIFMSLRYDKVLASDITEVYALKDDPQAGREYGDILDDFYENITEQEEVVDEYGTGLLSLPQGYTHADRFNGVIVQNGVDVSYYQKTIDWNAVKAEGIDFAFIRVGYRGYSQGTVNKDPKFDEYMQGAINAGIKVGVYIYSQAITTGEAVEEANYVSSQIGKYNVSFPVVIDYEYASVNGSAGGRLYDANLSVQQATDICKAFCGRIADAGYTPMVYANKSMLENKIDASQITSKYLVWLAHYTNQTSYQGKYNCWQYTSIGMINGISSRVDMDFWYGATDFYNEADYADVYDYEYYLSHNTDVASSVGNNRAAALTHFVEHGMAEGRTAKAEFNVYYYRQYNQDLAAIYGDDLKSYYIHYINYGKAEGRVAYDKTTKEGVTVLQGVDYSGVYNYQYYVNYNPDILKTYGDDDKAVLTHFVQYGMSEGRQGNDDFNVYTYKNRYSDLRAAYGNDLKAYYMHYINYGKTEGRTGTGTAEIVATTVYNGQDYNAVYDYNYYVANNPDVVSALGTDDETIIKHFVENGMSEGRQGKENFNVYTYKNRYSDLRAVYGNDLRAYYMHYIKYGQTEGRSGEGIAEAGNENVSQTTNNYNGQDYSAVYDYSYYIANNTDVAAELGTDEEAVLRHFVENGMSEGRRGCESFDVYAYKEKNQDISAVYGDDLKAYYMHYIHYGRAEGRATNY